MIFVTLGSQKFQFNRLLMEIDRLIEEGVITEEVYAQIGYSDYVPKHFQYKQFMDRDEFSEWQDKCDVVITHGGTGAIIGAVKKGKKVIAVPRLAKYGEHVDDHQIQLLQQFEDMQIIKVCYYCDSILGAIKEVSERDYVSYTSNTEKIIESIEKYIENQ